VTHDDRDARKTGAQYVMCVVSPRRGSLNVVALVA
jgi:hypothetical protein